MKLKSIFIVAFLLLSATRLFAHIPALGGKVIDAQTKESLPGAAVSVPDLRITVITDMNGSFNFKNIPSRGRFLVEVKFIGYKTLTRTIDFATATDFNFELEPSMIEAREVVVTGSAFSSDNRRNSTSVATVGKAELLSRPSTNLIDAISRIPGVAQVTTGSAISKPVIRGLSYNRVLTMNNGVKQQGQQWGDEHGIEIDQYSADRVEVLRGPASLMYGSDALGGVINILDALPAPEGTIQGEFLTNYATNNGLSGSSLMLQGNADDFVYRARGSYKNAYSYKTPAGYVPNSGFNETDFEGQIGLNKKWGYAHVDASGFRTNIGFYEPAIDASGNFIDDNGNTFTESQFKDRTPAFPKQDVRHYKIALNSNILLGSGSLKTTLGFQHNLRRELAEPDANPDLFLNMSTYSYDLKYAFNEANGWAPVIGTSGEIIHSLNTGGNEQLIPDFDSQAAGMFAYVKKTWNNNTFNVGGRFDYRKLDGKAFDNGNASFNAFSNTFSNVSGAAGYTHEFNDQFSFKTNAGTAFRAPNIAELSSNGVHEGAFRYEIGNADLKPEQSYQLDASFDYQSDKVSASLGGFVNYIDKYIYYKNTNGETISAEGNTYPVYRFIQDNALLHGLEATLTLHPVDFIHFENSYSYTLATNQATNQPLPFIPAAVLHNELRFEPAIKGTKKSYVSIGLDNVFDQDKVDQFETPTSGYSLLNAGIGTTLKLSKRQDMTLYVSGKNLLDKKYYDHLSRFKPGRLDELNPAFGIYNPGRTISFGLNLPFSLK
jgi:iron complex outermembrane recepter protein